jgi:hypothetical protein
MDRAMAMTQRQGTTDAAECISIESFSKSFECQSRVFSTLLLRARQWPTDVAVVFVFFL